MLEDQHKIPSRPELNAKFTPEASVADDALIITADGLFIGAVEVDPATRLGTRVIVFPCAGEHVPPRLLDLVGDTGFASGLPVGAAVPRSAGVVLTRVPTTTASTIVEVAGSRSDFEYHLPASPKFFVGRNKHVRRLASIMDEVAQPAARAQVVVFNAQSGWGKSSLALHFAAAAKKRNGVGICVDCRTADQPGFVAAAMRRAIASAASSGLAHPPPSASYASVPSVLETLSLSSYQQRPICIFFDQFENVFRRDALTREFRDLALGICDIEAPIVLGFAWKTDLVGFTETHPYQLRDDIRSRAAVFTLDPFGPKEISDLITRLQRACGQKLLRDLRERLREYSQGLPWLFKKLASHIQREISSGVTQEQLLAEVLNVQSLFETDLKGLTPTEREALAAIARASPILATDAVESHGADVVQTLLHQRLLVPVGERLDVYWDTFRDYLVQGSVPIQDSYILRLTPNSVTKLLKVIKDSGNSTTTEAVATRLGTSRIAVFNMSRDLRQLGVLAPTERTLHVIDEIYAAADPNAALKAKVAIQLKRHRAYSLLLQLAGQPGTPVAISAFTEALIRQYPAVNAKVKTWGTYAGAFLHWFRYAGLAALERESVTPGREQPVNANLFELRRAPRRRGLVVFPRCPPGSVLAFIEALHRGERPHARRPLAEGDAVLLGLAQGSAASGFRLTPEGSAIAAASEPTREKLLAPVLVRQESYRIAAAMVALDPGTRPVTIGLAVARHYNLPWKTSTATAPGKHLRAWLRAAGVGTRMRSAVGPG